MQVRVLMSAANSGKAFDLRCKVREGLASFLAREYPASLPRVRNSVETGEWGPGAAPEAAAG
jgi:hypothetical protein